MKLSEPMTRGKSTASVIEMGLRSMHGNTPATSTTPIEYGDETGLEMRRVVTSNGKTGQYITRAFFVRDAFVAVELVYFGNEPVAERDRFFNSLRFGGISTAPRPTVPAATVIATRRR
jgi:hypothetical protein